MPLEVPPQLEARPTTQRSRRSFLLSRPAHAGSALSPERPDFRAREAIVGLLPQSHAFICIFICDSVIIAPNAFFISKKVVVSIEIEQVA